MKALGMPVENRHGLRPARDQQKRLAPLTIAADLDTKRWLKGAPRR
jgi:hypothetical protein